MAPRKLAPQPRSAAPMRPQIGGLRVFERDAPNSRIWC